MLNSKIAFKEVKIRFRATFSKTKINHALNLNSNIRNSRMILPWSTIRS